jgi:hypothetical protein
LLIAESIVFLAECLWLFPKCALLYPVSQLLLTMVFGASSGPDWGAKKQTSRCHTVFFRVLGPYYFITHDRSNGSIGVSNSVTSSKNSKQIEWLRVVGAGCGGNLKTPLIHQR